MFAIKQVYCDVPISIVLFTSAVNSMHHYSVYHAQVHRFIPLCPAEMAAAACFRLLLEQELGNVLTEHRCVCQESDPGGLYPPATFHL